jgi:hypothetical protein
MEALKQLLSSMKQLAAQCQSPCWLLQASRDLHCGSGAAASAADNCWSLSSNERSKYSIENISNNMCVVVG